MIIRVPMSLIRWSMVDDKWVYKLYVIYEYTVTGIFNKSVDKNVNMMCLSRLQQVRCVKIWSLDYESLHHIREEAFVRDSRGIRICLTPWPPVVAEHHLIPSRTRAPVGVGYVSDGCPGVTLISSVGVGAASVVEPAPASALVATSDGRWRHGCSIRERHRVLGWPLE